MESSQSRDKKRKTTSDHAQYVNINVERDFINAGFNNNESGEQHGGSINIHGQQHIGGFTSAEHEHGTPKFPLPKRIVGGMFQTNMKKILGWLRDERSNTIAVHGMGGVGKTALLKHLHNHLKDHTDVAGHVYWVTVSADCTASQLQGKIAKAFRGREITEETLDERAAELNAKLTNKGRFVLILDDLWRSYNIEDEVGVPLESNGCKIILSTRTRDICLRMVDCADYIVKVEVLSEADAWTLFHSTLGNSKLLAPVVREVAEHVAAECKCLPLAIITVAASMKGKFDKKEWENALFELRNPNKSHIAMKNEVYDKLKFSYDRLQDNLQPCFLTCIMYAEDEDICRDELIKLWRWEGLLPNAGGMKEQEAEGHTILKMLVRSCLLESSENWDGEDCVKMHDLIRQMAVFITQGRFIARARQLLHEMPEEKDWTQDLINVSLRENNIQVVPSHMSPNCLNLRILMLQHNKELSSVPDLFFVHMKALTVIDLTGTSIEGVPDSVSGLVNLKALLLCWCYNLEHVPSVAQLTKL